LGELGGPAGKEAAVCYPVGEGLSIGRAVPVTAPGIDRSASGKNNLDLEIRFVGRRNTSVRVGIIVRAVVLDIFGAYAFVPNLVRGPQISNGSLPRRCEGAGILHGEFELQSLASVVGVGRIAGRARPLFVGPLLRFLGGFVVDQP